jgi:hypothetical protein
MLSEQVVEQLMEMGYFKFVPDSEFETARQELTNSLNDGLLEIEWNSQCISRENRIYPADSENLAEGCVGETILLMRGVLAMEGVRFDSIEDEFDDESYNIVIGGRRFLVHDERSLADGSGWALATRRLLEIVNELLAEAGSDEQLYGISGGNDGRAVFLTRSMYNLIRSRGLGSNESPYPSTAINLDGSIRW